MKRTTIKDIANRLKVSVSTVSRGLRGHPAVSKKTQISINKLAKKLNYSPNILAAGLKTSKTRTIGIITPKIVHPFFSMVIKGIENWADIEYNHVIICNSNESYQREIKNVDTLLRQRVDGILISMSKETKKYDHFQKVLDYNIPIVFFDRICEDIKTDRVIVNDYKAAYNATEYLIKKGHKKIIHFSTSPHLLIGWSRIKGFKEALLKNNLDFNDGSVIQCDSYEQSLDITAKLLNNNNIPDAIFAVNDKTALGAIKAIKQKGLSVPKDIAVIGFTNEPISEMIEPSLTTIDQRGFEMGKVAAQLLLKRINANKNEKIVPETIILQTKLIVRDST